MVTTMIDELKQANRDIDRAKSLMERAFDALAEGDIERAQKLLNTSHEYLTGGRDRLVRLCRAEALSVAEVGC